MKKIISAVLAGFSLFALISCTSEVTLTAQKDGSVKVNFDGKCGPYFETMLRSFSEAENGPLFDVSGIKTSFITDGFQNVAVKAPDSVGISVDMIAPKKTYLFSSGLVISAENNVFLKVSPEILKNFYKSADEDIVSVLDLLLAPVFNDEVMSQDEYLETIGSFYGEDASAEIGSCEIKLNLVSADGKKKEVSVPLTKLLTLTETLGY